jgi:CRISPR-associated endonuclease Csn1
MSITLGIDLGVTSVGWALVNEHSIIALGTHIFPVGVQDDAFYKSHVEKPKNEARRTARGIRRLNQRYKLRRQRLTEVLLTIDAFPDQELMAMSSRDLYHLRKKGLDHKLELKEFGRILYLLNQRRGFKSNRKDKGKADEELGIVKESIAKLEEEIRMQGARTIGEYFANLFPSFEDYSIANPDAPVQRIRKRYLGRKQYIHEFNLLWETQSKFHSELTEDLKDEIGKRTIFYQRKLKSSKDLVNNCPFEPNRKCAPKSHPLFQSFRTWQYITSIRIKSSSGEETALSLDQMISIEPLFSSSAKKINKTQLIKTLSLGKNVEFNDVVADLPSETTIYKISQALGFMPEEEQLEWIWHTLHSADDDELLKNTLLRKLDLPKESKNKINEIINSLVKISLEPDYGRLSKAAIKKILPFLKQGNVYSKACELAGYHHSLEADKNEAQYSIQDFLQNITNPLVKRSVNEAIRVIRSLQTKYNPDEIRIEFIRELNMPKDKRELIHKRNTAKEKRRTEYTEFLLQNFPTIGQIRKDDLIKFELFLELEYHDTDLNRIMDELNIPDLKKLEAQAAKDQLLRYRLWKECNRISLYTGKPISLSKLFSPEIHVEHIIPFSRSYDDSFTNKTLCEASVNDEKKNRTPFEFFGGKETEWKAFKARVNRQIEGRKKTLLLMEKIEPEWLEKQLSNTAHAANTLRKICKNILFKDKPVEVSNGATTSILRKLWGLDRLLSGKEMVKTREDHRHHAIDALVVACKTRSAVQKLSTLAGINYRGRLELKGSLDYPFGQFREQAIDALEEVFVTYRKADRLISKRKNPYKYWKKGRVKPDQITMSARGGLHNETFYGLIADPADQTQEVFVTRKDLRSFDKEKHIESVVDKGIRKIMEAQLKLCNGDFKKAFQEPLIYQDKKGRNHIIRHVRVKVPDSLIELRENKKSSVYVASGSNYGMVIYQNEAGKRIYETLNFISAVKTKQEGRKLFPNNKNGFDFYCFLQINDLLIMYNQSPDEINWNDRKDLANRLFRVVKMDQKGVLVFGRANKTGYSADKAEPVKLICDTNSGIVIRNNFNTFRGVKVRVDISGMLHRV